MVWHNEEPTTPSNPHSPLPLGATRKCKFFRALQVQFVRCEKREENLGKINSVGGWVKVGGGVPHPHPIRANCVSIYMQTLFLLVYFFVPDGHHHTHGEHAGCWTVGPGLS